MKALITNSILAFLLFLQLPAGATEPLKGANCIPVKSLAESKLAYKGGERLEFVIHYKWGAINSDVAKANVKLDTMTLNGVPVFHCSVYGRTARFYDMFFKVREDFQSWFTRDGIVPVKFTRDSREGNYYAVNKYDYVWEPDETKHIDAELESSRRPVRNELIALTGCTYDLPSLFFMARNMNFAKVKPNVKYPMTFVIDDDIYNVYFIWLGREKKAIKGVGTVQTMKFAAKLIAGDVFGSGQDMFVWISEDENRIPVYFEAPLRVGTATGWLSDWKNLKHPFESRISTK